MSAFDLAADHDSLSLADQARSNPLDLSQPAGFFTGAWKGPALGLGGLLTNVQRTTGLALGAVAGSFDMLTGDAIKAQEKVFEHIVTPADKLSRHLVPKPDEIGMAGQLLHGLIKIGGEAVAFGAPGVLALETVGGTLDALDKGVDLQTAAKVGGVQGAAMTAGVIAPMTLGASGLGMNVMYGAGINLAQGVFQRGATSEIYAKAGRHDLAMQFKALDGEAMAVDAILGAAFAGGGRFMQIRGEKARADAVAEYKAKISEMLAPEQIDAALTKNEQIKMERSGMGLPADLPSRDAYIANLTGAIDDLMEGRPVTMRQEVGDMIPDEAAAKVQADVAEGIRVSIEEADRLIANQARRFRDNSFFEARQAAVEEMNLRDSEYSYRATPTGQLRTSAEIGADIAAESARAEALQRIATGQQLIELPGSAERPATISAKPAEAAQVAIEIKAPAPRYIPVAKKTGITSANFTDLAATQTRYQGNKREFFKNNGAVLAKEVAPYTHDVESVFDMYAGGGTYGLSMIASGAFPKVKRVVINEVDEVRNARLQGAIEKGGRIMDPWTTDPVMIQLAEKLKPLIGKSSTPAAMAMEGKGKYSDYGDWIAQNLVTDEQKTARLALHDVMFSGRTATWDRLIKNATEDADRIHALANQAKSNGATIEVTALDATGTEAIALVQGAGRSFVLLDPPYHKTSAGTYAAKEATDFGGDVFLHKNMIAAREMANGNSVVYNNSDTPGVREVAKEVFRGNMAQHRWKRQNGQQEFLGVYHDTATSAGSSRGVLGERAPAATGGVLAVDGGYSARQIDSGAPAGDQAGRLDRPTGQRPEAVIPLDDTDATTTVAEAQDIIADLETARAEQDVGLRAAVACFLRAA